MILADQLLYGYGFELAVLQAALRPAGATIFTKRLIDRQQYDVVEFGPSGEPTSIVPNHRPARGNAAIAGFYLFDRQVGQITAELRSLRGDRVTFSDIARAYLERGSLHVVQLDTESAWFDIGTHEVAMSASVFVEMVQNERDRSIGCIEEEAFLRGLITAERLLELSALGSNDYCRYLRRIAWSADSSIAQFVGATKATVRGFEVGHRTCQIDATETNCYCPARGRRLSPPTDCRHRPLHRTTC